MKEYNFYVYILTNRNDKVMYVGMTNDLERRMYEHKNKLVDGFTKKYNVNKLVYYEHGTDVHAVIAREKEGTPEQSALNGRDGRPECD